jgi:CRP/FNR family cyclic AMP-dependent transcriptional regulator
VSLSRQEKVAWLRRVPLFAGCGPEVVERLADGAGEVSFASGEVVVQQGQVGNGLYIVVSGSVSVVAGDEELARLGPGETIGELSVIDQQPRAATAVALETTDCLGLASWEVIALLEQDPSLAMNLLRELAGRLRQADARLRQ